MSIEDPSLGLKATATTPAVAPALRLPPVAVPDPSFAERREALELRLVHFVAAAGRSAAVLMAVTVPYVAVRPLVLPGLIAIGVLTLVWSAALHSSRAAAPGTLSPTPTLGIGAASGLVAIAALDPWFPGLQLGLPTLLMITAGVFVSAAVWEGAVRRTSVGRRRVLVVGTNDVSELMASELRRTGGRDIALVAHVADGETDRGDAEVPLLGALEELGPIVEAQRPDLVVLTDEDTYADAVECLLDVPEPHFRVVGLAGFFEHVFGRVPIEQMGPAWFMSILHLRQPIYARWMKRTFDLLLASIGLVLMSPVLLAVAVTVRATGRPVLYRQTRVGEGGRLFTIYKFRTMLPDAEAHGACFASKCDIRATRCGRFLRRVHLDELPQLWNVLKGDMAIVGPRPERPEFVEVLERSVPFWTRRSLMTPGITGWAQLRSGYAAEECEMAEKLSYDLWYLRHRSLFVDLAICLETIGMELRSFLPARLQAGWASADRGVGR